LNETDSLRLYYQAVATMAKPLSLLQYFIGASFFFKFEITGFLLNLL